MIKLIKVKVQGFRLLENVEIAVETNATVIVGRNNSGKTSLTEVFDRFLGEQAGRFRLEDFAATIRPQFLSAKAFRDAEESKPEAVLAELPTISLTLWFSYDQNTDDLGPLSPFIIDLVPECMQMSMKKCTIMSAKKCTTPSLFFEFLFHNFDIAKDGLCSRI